MSCYFCQPIATDGVREGGRAFRRRHFVAGVPLPARSAAAVFRRWATLPLSPRRPLPLPARFVAGFSQRVSKDEVRLGLGTPTASALTNSASVIAAKDLTTAQPLGEVR